MRARVIGLIIFGLLAGPVTAETFTFNSGSQGLQDLNAATVVGAEFDLQLTAGPAGALLYDLDLQGMGINTRELGVGVDSDRDKFNLMGGTGPLAGQGESLTFSFNRSGIITGLNFDGVKDETFEYFRLDVPHQTSLFFFDSQADPAAIDVPGDVIFLLEDATFDDEIGGLAIPFTAGTTFELVYGELGVGNGARLEAITVQVPEPAWGPWLLVAALSLWALVRKG
ncbi:MAG: hypothetical protein AAGF97_15350 [Planctomycetota bacterium]